MKNKKISSILDYYSEHHHEYEDKSIEEVLKNLIKNFSKKYPELSSKNKTILVAVDSITDAIDSIDFNWFESMRKNKDFVYFKNEELINNLFDFYKENSDKYNSNQETSWFAVYNLLGDWSHYIMEVMKNAGTFIDTSTSSKKSVVFIKTSDLGDWNENSNNFVSKTFGDKNSKVVINFVFREGDSDFTSKKFSDTLNNKKIESLPKDLDDNSSCEKLHQIIKKAKIYNFREGFPENTENFSKNGIYVMFELGETGHSGNRVVRIGINKEETIHHRLSNHKNGNKDNSIFRKHLFRILKTEEKVSDYIEKNIAFAVIDDPENRRKKSGEDVGLEEKIISSVSKCQECIPSSNWLGGKSETEQIKSSGLWNVHHVGSEHSLEDSDLDYIEKNLIKS